MSFLVLIQILQRFKLIITKFTLVIVSIQMAFDVPGHFPLNCKCLGANITLIFLFPMYLHVTGQVYSFLEGSRASTTAEWSFIRVSKLMLSPGALLAKISLTKPARKSLVALVHIHVDISRWPSLNTFKQMGHSCSLCGR